MLPKKKIGGAAKPVGAKKPLGKRLLGSTKKKVGAGVLAAGVAAGGIGAGTGAGPLGSLQQLVGNITVDTSEHNQTTTTTEQNVTNSKGDTGDVVTKQSSKDKNYGGDGDGNHIEVNDQSKSIDEINAGGDANINF